ncbi:sulfotransferase family protein [Halorhodospira sp. 9621]|uniref:sulfotransferase family protein n=1 Tax=Halorhodospira sp. 9621 TaxID=2899135 RepID=UPI001EE8D522|nr:sulfotransferase family protein [Halorhodospira sp. 9621]MCG5533625.1 sulfotransferase family protein [Halorhodospira sp. 9621]
MPDAPSPTVHFQRRLCAWKGHLQNTFSLRKQKLRNAAFYRRYPYAQPLSHRKADTRGMVQRDLRFFYNRVPKAANTTIMHTLADALGLPDKQRATIDDQFRRPSQLSDRQVSELLQNGFKFTFVRNPYTRVLSAYLDKIVNGPRCPRHLRHTDGSAPTFVEFCRHLERGAIYKDPHWIPQCWLLLLPPEAFDFIGKIECLETDLEQVYQRVVPGYGKPPTTCAPHRTGANGRIQEHIDEEAAAILQRLYADDFAAFGYSVRPEQAASPQATPDGGGR